MKSHTVLHFQCLMTRLTVSEDKFDFLFYISQEDCGIECLKEIANIMKDSDVSPLTYHLISIIFDTDRI
jgi:hypothetical protein